MAPLLKHNLRFAYIAPIKFLGLTVGKNMHLALAHIAQKSDEYCEFFCKQRLGDQDAIDVITILDNGVFEATQQGSEAPDPSYLIDLGKMVNASHIVLPDFPAKIGYKTVAEAPLWAEHFKSDGFGTFFVPQSEVGDFEDYINCFAWAASSPLIDYIGISILGVPNAYGVVDVPLQRFVSRFMLMTELKDRGLLQLAKSNKKKIHMLGLLDGPREIVLMDGFDIDSWDSSQPVWAGLNKRRFGVSPTGLGAHNGKDSLPPVDFEFSTANISPSFHGQLMSNAKYNMQYVERLVEHYNRERE